MPTWQEFWNSKGPLSERAKVRKKRIEDRKDIPASGIPEPDNPDPRVSDEFLKAGRKAANVQAQQEEADRIIGAK